MAEEDYTGRSGAASYSARRVSSPTRMDRPGGHPGRDTTSSGRDWDQESKNRALGGNNNQTGQSDSNQGEHKFETQLNQLFAAGKGNTAQANVLKNYLYGVKTEGGNNAYYEWVDKTYPSGPLNIKDQPEIYNWGEYDVDAPMAFGTGSLFGESTGIPGQSNVAVTDTLKFIMKDYVNQGYEPQHAAEKAFKKFYVSNNVDYVNFMGDKTLPYSQQPAVKALMADHGGSGGGGSGGSGGGWGGYGGYGGGGSGGDGGGGYYESPSGMPRGNPNEAWGAQNHLLQAMITTHGGTGFQQGFHRGGIVTLVED